MRTRQPSPDGKVGTRVIHALSAVQDILPAAVEILSPQDGSTVSPFQPATFTAAVFSDGHGTPTITWRRNGIVIGTGPAVTVTLPAGNHTVTARATFPDGASAADTIHVASVDHVPQVELVSPWLPNTTPPTFQQSELIPFRAITLDDLGPLPDGQVSWYLDAASTPFATGHEAIVTTGAAPGHHTITVQGCDAVGQCRAVAAPIVIQPDGTNLPPSAKITNPANGAMLWVTDQDATGYFHEITLAGTVADPEGAPVSVTWLDNGVPIADTLNPTVRLAGGCGYYTHNLVLRVTDNAGTTRHDKVVVTVNMVC